MKRDGRKIGVVKDILKFIKREREGLKCAYIRVKRRLRNYFEGR